MNKFLKYSITFLFILSIIGNFYFISELDKKDNRIINLYNSIKIKNDRIIELSNQLNEFGMIVPKRLIPQSNYSDTTTYTVYITKTGSKYHKSGCSYLKSKIPIDKEEAIEKGYSSCSRCNP